MDAIFPKEELISRSAIRGYGGESEKVINDFEEINTDFLIAIFNENTNASYNEIYTFYLGLWIKTYEWYMYNNRLTYCVIDSDWFANNYKPTEGVKWRG